MARLIDADKLKNVFEGYSYEEDSNPHFPLDMVKKDIDEQPTVEAVPVVHGEWIRTRFASECICSNCQALTYAELTRTGYKNYNFCPQCGCDMRTSAE